MNIQLNVIQIRELATFGRFLAIFTMGITSLSVCLPFWEWGLLKKDTTHTSLLNGVYSKMRSKFFAFRVDLIEKGDKNTGDRIVCKYFHEP